MCAQRGDYYVKVDYADGVYSGYMNKGLRHGIGTWVNAEATERWEGLWVMDHFCAGIGQKEFSDGTVLKGKFVNGFYQEVSCSLQSSNPQGC